MQVGPMHCPTPWCFTFVPPSQERSKVSSLCYLARGLKVLRVDSFWNHLHFKTIFWRLFRWVKVVGPMHCPIPWCFTFVPPSQERSKVSSLCYLARGLIVLRVDFTTKTCTGFHLPRLGRFWSAISPSLGNCLWMKDFPRRGHENFEIS